MKRTARITLPLVALAASTASMAHPGDHAAQTVGVAIAHFLTDPWHVGIAAAAALAAVALFRRRANRSRGSRP